MRAATFSLPEIQAAVVLALALQIAFFTLLAVAGETVPPSIQRAKEEFVPISVKPVLDLPLLKKGGKPQKHKLPDMWRKPKPVKRVKARSAPTPDAEKTPEAIPSSKVAEKDEEAPKPDDEVIQDIEDMPDTDEKVEEQNLPEEGAADGVEEGTEPDPMKARAVSLYKRKLIAWFNRRFSPPTEIPCEELKQLSSNVTATMSPDLFVTGYSVNKPSGNATFDARVKAAMDGSVGQAVPPPPSNYPELAESVIQLGFYGKSHCK